VDFHPRSRDLERRFRRLSRPLDDVLTPPWVSSGPRPFRDRVRRAGILSLGDFRSRARSPFTTDAALLGALSGGLFEIRYRLPTSATATTHGHFDLGSSFLAGTTAETVFLV
jgi:hypothetical protein